MHGRFDKALLACRMNLWSNSHMSDEQDRLAQSKRILRQVERDSDHPGFAPMAHLQRHLSATDVNGEDRLEVWGTRIGRGLGLLIMVFLLLAIIVWFGAAKP